MFDIAIVGAGLAGAATAVLLAKRDPNLRIALLEKRSEEDIVNEKSGRAINLLLSPRGVKTLERCGLSKAELTQYFNRIDGRIVHVNNQPPMSVPYGPDRFNLSIGRGQLVSKLLSIARGLSIEIMMGQELVGLESASNNTTRLTLVNQTDASIKSLDCSLVIASDGIHSMARGFVPITSKKKFTSYGYKELTIMPSDGEYAMDPRGIHIFPRGKFFMVALPNTDKTSRCTMILPLEGETSFASLNNEQKVKEFFQIHFNEIIPHMPNVTKEFMNNPTSTLGMIKCNSFHYKDRFVLIGDAAHAILPFLGQGMNLGLEDALIIDDIYARTMSLQSIGPEFTRLQKKNADAIQDMSEQNFIELSANLGSNRFLVQKKVENVLASYFPSLFMPPPFISVNFLDLTYDQVRQGLERNKAIASGVTKAAVLTSILGVALKAKL